MQALEERGIGRPSTYASILGTILDRGYVFKRGTALVPSFLAFAVTGLLEQHFERLVDYDFTAKLEDDLDRIAAGDQERLDWLRLFYFGGGADGDEGLHALVSDISRHRRARGQLAADRRGHRPPRRPLRARTSSGARSARACRRTWRRTS